MNNNHIYIVLAIVLIIWFAISCYLFYTNRNLKKLEDAVLKRKNNIDDE